MMLSAEPVRGENVSEEYRLRDVLGSEAVVDIDGRAVPARELFLMAGDRITINGAEWRCVFRGSYESAKLIQVRNARGRSIIS